jgi:hypothetical protein
MITQVVELTICGLVLVTVLQVGNAVETMATVWAQQIDAYSPNHLVLVAHLLVQLWVVFLDLDLVKGLVKALVKALVKDLVKGLVKALVKDLVKGLVKDLVKGLVKALDRGSETERDFKQVPFPIVPKRLHYSNQIWLLFLIPL